MTILKQVCLISLILIAAINSTGKVEANEFSTGGVGINERKSLPKESFHLILATVKGAYLAGIEVNLENGEGKTIGKIDGAGPWVWSDLPAGSYRVLAKRAATGEIQSAYFKLGKTSRKTVNLAFKKLMENDI